MEERTSLHTCSRTSHSPTDLSDMALQKSAHPSEKENISSWAVFPLPLYRQGRLPCLDLLLPPEGLECWCQRPRMLMSLGHCTVILCYNFFPCCVLNSLLGQYIQRLTSYQLKTTFSKCSEENHRLCLHLFLTVPFGVDVPLLEMQGFPYFLFFA